MNSRCVTHQCLIPFSSSVQVLLPPKTALLYSQLLQLEVSQLAMGRNADWDRILHIRHLKDRMIRKCQRLSRTAHTPGTIPAAFRIVHAPPDFRLKEMERWLRDHVSRRKGTKEVRRQPSAETANTQSQSSQRAYTQTQPTSRAPQTPRVPTSAPATPVQRVSSTRPLAGVRRQGSGSSRSSNYGDSRASTESPRQRPTAYTQNLPPRNAYLSPVAEERSVTPQPSTPLTNPYGDTPQIAVEEATSSSPQQGARTLSLQIRSRISTARRACSCRWPRWLLPCCQAPRNLCQSHWSKRCLSPSSSHSYPQSCRWACRSPRCPSTSLSTQTSPWPDHRVLCSCDDVAASGKAVGDPAPMARRKWCHGPWTVIGQTT